MITTIVATDTRLNEQVALRLIPGEASIAFNLCGRSVEVNEDGIDEIAVALDEWRATRQPRQQRR